MNIILDTNVLISALLGKNLRERLEPIMVDPEIRLLVCTQLLDEFMEVIQRPKFEHLVSKTQITTYLDFLHPKFEHIELVSNVSLCRDKEDDFLLTLARDGKATYLITGDKDLITIDTFEQTRIVTLTEFLQHIISL